MISGGEKDITLLLPAEILLKRNRKRRNQSETETIIILRPHPHI
jgi:hypothetical protein